MNLTLDELKLWLGVANAIGTAAVGVYMWLQKRNDKTDTEIKSLRESIDTKMDELETRVTVIEAHLKHMPTHAEIVDIKVKLERVMTDNESQTRLLEKLENWMRRIDEWMRENK